MQVNDIIEAAEDLLSNRFGGNQRLGEVSELAGSGTATVLRVRLAPSPFIQQRNLVVKFIPARGEQLDDVALMREVAAYQFTTSLSEDVRPGPILLAHDIAKRILVITDSGDGDTLDELLEQRDPQKRKDILRELGTALGKMHAGTAGKEKDFEILLARIVRTHLNLQQQHENYDDLLVASVEIGINTLNSNGLELPQEVLELAGEAQARLTKGGERAFTPFDLSPDNIIVGKRMEFLDYEWAGFRDVTFDVACVIAGFPQYISARPPSGEEAAIFVQSWVREVSGTWPSVLDEEHLHSRVLVAFLGWALASISLMRFGTFGTAVEDAEADPNGSDLLRPSDQRPFSPEELLIRQDFHGTFQALANFAEAGSTPLDTQVAAFAKAVAKRVEPPLSP